MKRRIGTFLLMIALLQTLLPISVLAAEPDDIADDSELDHAEIPLDDPCDPSIDATGHSEDDPDASQVPGADRVVDDTELAYFEIPVIDPRLPPVNAIDNSEDDPNAVQAADKWAVECINRLKLPQFAINFYNTLVRESKPASSSGLGRDGVLIDPSQSSNRQVYSSDTAYVLPIPYPTEDELRHSGFQFTNQEEFIKNCVNAVYYAFDWDHPEVFWLRGSYYFYNDTASRTFYITLAYEGFPADKSNRDIRAEAYQNPSVIKRDINALNQSVASIINKTDMMSSNYDKIAYFNEWLTTHNQYNYTVAYTNEDADRAVYESISALITKDGKPGGGRIGVDGPVCEGYARAFLLLCQQVDIPCVQVNGAGHRWNYVQVDPSDSRWYAMDVTWNDPTMPEPETPTLEEYLSWGGDESTAHTLVGSDTIVYDWESKTFLEQHPEVNTIGKSFVYAIFKMGPKLNDLAYVDSVVVTGLEAPEAGAVPDTSVTLTSNPKSNHHPSTVGTREVLTNPVVTWSPVPENGRFAAGTTYTATITYTPLRQGYGLTPADASKITVPGAANVTVDANGAIHAVFSTREASGLHGKVAVSVDGASPEQDGAAYVVNDAVITIQVTPDPGYHLSILQVIREDNGQPVSLSGAGTVYTFKMPPSDVSIRAVFSIS